MRAALVVSRECRLHGSQRTEQKAELVGPEGALVAMRDPFEPVSGDRLQISGKREQEEEKERESH